MIMSDPETSTLKSIWLEEKENVEKIGSKTNPGYKKDGFQGNEIDDKIVFCFWFQKKGLCNFCIYFFWTQFLINFRSLKFDIRLNKSFELKV